MKRERATARNKRDLLRDWRRRQKQPPGLRGASGKKQETTKFVDVFVSQEIDLSSLL
jgi:hypothetical protein